MANAGEKVSGEIGVVDLYLTIHPPYTNAGFYKIIGDNLTGPLTITVFLNLRFFPQ